VVKIFRYADDLITIHVDLWYVDKLARDGLFPGLMGIWRIPEGSPEKILVELNRIVTGQ